MWTTEHSIETTARPEAVWAIWADVARWPELNHDLVRSELSGPFAVGSTIRMFPSDQDEPVELRIATAREPSEFVDEAHVGDVVVRTTHRVERIDEERVRVRYRMEITGLTADTVGPQLGPQISADFPQVLADLAQRAEAR